MRQRNKVYFCLVVAGGRVHGWLADPQAERQYKRLQAIEGVTVYRGCITYILMMAQVNKAPENMIKALERLEALGGG